MSDEEYVKSKWEHVIVCDGSYRSYVKGAVLLNWANHCFYEFKDFAGAYTFTLEREQKIREVEEEIALIQHEIWLWPNYSQENPAFQRILERLRAAIVGLKEGMK